jgi:hypothetical protein
VLPLIRAKFKHEFGGGVILPLQLLDNLSNMVFWTNVLKLSQEVIDVIL